MTGTVTVTGARTGAGVAKTKGKCWESLPVATNKDGALDNDHNTSQETLTMLTLLDMLTMLIMLTLTL